MVKLVQPPNPKMVVTGKFTFFTRRQILFSSSYKSSFFTGVQFLFCSCKSRWYFSSWTIHWKSWWVSGCFIKARVEIVKIINLVRDQGMNRERVMRMEGRVCDNGRQGDGLVVGVLGGLVVKGGRCELWENSWSEEREGGDAPTHESSLKMLSGEKSEDAPTPSSFQLHCTYTTVNSWIVQSIQSTVHYSSVNSKYTAQFKFLTAV